VTKKNLYSDYATGWTVRVSNTDGGKRLSLFRKPVQNGPVVPSLFLEGKAIGRVMVLGLFTPFYSRGLKRVGL
jgi:hypothetical protein